MIKFSALMREQFLETLEEKLTACDPERSVIVEHFNTAPDPKDPTNDVNDWTAGYTLVIRLNGGAS